MLASLARLGSARFRRRRAALHSSRPLRSHPNPIAARFIPSLPLLLTLPAFLQPRRLATTSVCARVAQELNEPRLAGYMIRGANTTTADTDVTFCTTGIVNAMFADSPELDEINVLIVDEVHERSVHVDLLLTNVKNLLREGRRKDLRVVLMSATIDVQLFSTFFQPVLGGSVPPFIQIPGRTFPVDCLYLEDLVERTGTHIERGSA